MKNALASDSCPATPTSSVSPIAPIAALIANRPVCIQNASAYCGSHRSRAASATHPIVRARLDTGDLPWAEPPRRPPKQYDQEHDVGHDVRQAAPEERQLVLVSGRQLLRDAAHEPTPEHPGDRAEPPEHGDRDRAEGEQPGGIADAAGGEAHEERAADRGKGPRDRPS